MHVQAEAFRLPLRKDAGVAALRVEVLNSSSVTLNIPARSTNLEDGAILEQVHEEQLPGRHLLPVDDGLHRLVDRRLADSVAAEAFAVADEYQRPHRVHAAEDSRHVRRSLHLKAHDIVWSMGTKCMAGNVWGFHVNALRWIVVKDRTGQFQEGPLAGWDKAHSQTDA